MARIPYVDPETVSEQVRLTLQQLPVQLNVLRMMAHAEQNFLPLFRLGTSIVLQQKLSAKLREIAVLCIARLSDAEYEWVQHVPVGKASGVTDAQIEALQRGETDAACFDLTERLVLRFTREVVRDIGASAATFEEVAKQFSPQEIVELILAIGYYMTLARLVRTLDIDPDPPRIADAIKTSAGG